MRRQVEHDGRLISYLEVRPSADREAGTLLLLHAFPLAAEMWRPQLAALPSSWRAVAPDFRGFGQSAPDPGPPGSGWRADAPLHVDDYAGDVLALLDHLDVRQVVVCGLSMGGYTAFALLRLAPDRIRGLVLADTRPDADSEPARAGREKMLASLPASGAAGVAQAMVPRLLGRTSQATRPQVVEQVRSFILAQAPDAIGAAVVRLMRRPDSTPLLGAIDRPTLVLVGDEDEVTGPDVARMMHGQIPGADLGIIGHAGHLSNLEQPTAFNTALDRFLSTRFIQP